MSIAVYPRLSELLRTKNLSVAELERQVEQRFGLSVNLKTLYRFTSSEPVQRADLEIAGAVAAVLGVGLGDLFDIQATPVDKHREETSVLDPAESRRLADLFDRHSRGVLSADEQRELEALVDEYGRRLHEMRVREYAKQRNISVEEARSEMAANLDQSITWWQEFEADLASRPAAVQEAKEREMQRAREGGQGTDVTSDPVLDNDPILAEVVRRLVEGLKPERIYLFGSKARGEAGPDSDYDLMVIVPHTEEPGYRLAQKAHTLMWDIGAGADILVWSRGAFDRRLHLRASLPATVVREGKLLYPGEIEEPLREEIEEALGLAREVHAAVLSRLPEEASP
jgi:uncharacterized protein